MCNLCYSKDEKAAFTLPNSKSKCFLNEQPDRPILLMLYEVTLPIIHKSDVDDMNDTPRLTELRVEKKWVLVIILNLESYGISEQSLYLKVT